MPWIAPAIDRSEAPTVAEERTSLETWLDYHRQTLLWKCSGLGAEELRRRAVEPSTLSLLGLVRHMAEVERSWFRRRLRGEDVEQLYCSEADPDGDFDGVDDADPEADFAAYAAEVEAARRASAGLSLDQTFVHPVHAMVIDLRWLHVHMIEEYARHNGHADLLRERIDGVTGD